MHVPAEAHLDNLYRLIDILESVEKEGNKNYDKLQDLPGTGAQKNRLLNDMEDLGVMIS